MLLERGKKTILKIVRGGNVESMDVASSSASFHTKFHSTMNSGKEMVEIPEVIEIVYTKST